MVYALNFLPAVPLSPAPSLAGLQLSLPRAGLKFTVCVSVCLCVSV